MSAKLMLAMVWTCFLVQEGLSFDHQTGEIIESLENSRGSLFARTVFHVYHMETDIYQQGSVIYGDYSALVTNDGTKPRVVVGSSSDWGYKEGVGKEARLYGITGFVQISNNQVIVAETYGECLRSVNRNTQRTSFFSGQCQNRDYAVLLDPQYKQDGWRPPMNSFATIIKDKLDPKHLLYSGKDVLLNKVDIETGESIPFIRSSLVKSTRALAQNDKGDMFVTSYSQLYSITYDTKAVSQMPSLTTLGGTMARFASPEDLRFIANNVLLMADTWNDDLKFIDLATREVAALNLDSCSGCGGRFWPTSFLLTGDSLYVNYKFKVVKFDYIGAFRTTQAITSTRPVTTSSPCMNQTQTYYIKPNSEKATVPVASGREIELPEGNHFLHTSGCVTTIQVVDNNWLLERRLNFRAQYPARCSLLTQNIVNSTVASTVTRGFDQLQKVCQKECRLLSESGAVTVCENDTLRVDWPTDQTFGASVTELPSELRKILTDRLVIESQQPIIGLVMIDRTPPVVFPTKTSSGAYAEIVLSSKCRQYKYDPTQDTCVI